MHLQAGRLPLICILVHRTLEKNVDFLNSLFLHNIYGNKYFIFLREGRDNGK